MTIDPGKVGHVVFAFIIVINIINITMKIKEPLVTQPTHSDPAKDVKLKVSTFELTIDHLLQARML